jgi:hypothetical protein
MSTSQSRLAAARAQFADANEGNTNKPRDSNFGNYYPFWDMKAGQRAVIRFLPDKDKTNKRDFLVEQVFHNLMVNGKKAKVPCMSQFGQDCPVCKISQDYYKVEGKDSPNGKKYWRKKQYLAQALILEDPLEPNKETGETHQGKIRYLSLGFQIYNIIKDAYASEDDLKDIPCHLENGYDFVIKKTQQGEYGSYATGTKFKGEQRPLTEEEMVIVEEGLIDLSTLLPKNPGVEIIQAKLNADLNGEEFSEARKPAAPKAAHEDDEESSPPVVTKPAARQAAVVESSDEGSSDVDDMLAQIRARRQGK